MTKKTAKPATSEEKTIWNDRHEMIEREVKAEMAVREAKRIKRMKFDREVPFDSSDLRVLKINPDGTAIIDTKDLCCVVIHNGDFDENGVEVCVVFQDFCPMEYGMTHTRSWNNSDGGRYTGFKKTAWAEVIDYEEYLIRENGGELRKVTPKAGNKPKRKSKPRLAKVG